ncbi:23325_t:CDS:2, partial [Racocetra persica]
SISVTRKKVNVNLTSDEEQSSVFFEELQIDIEAIDLVMNDDDLEIETFFDFETYKQDQETIKENSFTHYQRSICIDEDWSIDNIFKS